MKIIKTMSIIAVIVNALALISMLAWTPESSFGWSTQEQDDASAAIGLGLIALIYDLGFSITALVLSTKE
jgi:hypothetical protein